MRIVYIFEFSQIEKMRFYEKFIQMGISAVNSQMQS